jgi:23S rRNA (adenine2503-C2)-methyltransferase
MGMGEPLANYEATVKSLRILTDPHGLAISPRRITVSTVGLANGLRRLGSEGLRVNLAISLHATTDDLRSRLLPVNRRFAIEELLSVCRGFPLPLRQRITFEYVLLDGVNDSREDALRLAALLRGIRAKVNLIPFNDWPGSAFRRPMLPRILGFQSALLQRGITATVRWSKGVDIGAACGQLKETVPA